LRLGSDLIKRGHRLTVVVPHEGPLCDQLRQNGADVAIHPALTIVTRAGPGTVAGRILRLARLPFSALWLAAFIRRTRPEVVHSNTAVILSAALAAKLTGTPHVWHIREFFFEFGSLWKLYQRYIARLSWKIVCVSSAVADQFDETIKREKTCVIYDGIPEPPVESLSVVQDFRRRFGIGAENRGVAGVIGRIKFGRKGQETFVRAAALLRPRFPHARFIITGSPFPGNEQHLERLQVLIRELGVEDNVIFTGEMDDVGPVYASLDVLVLSSGLPEPFGLVLIEAMARRVPVIATRAGGPGEITDDGRAGILVAPNDPQDMADAIGRVFEDTEAARRIGEAGRRRYETMFQEQKFVDQMVALYQAAAGCCDEHTARVAG